MKNDFELFYSVEEIVQFWDYSYSNILRRRNHSMNDSNEIIFINQNYDRIKIIFREAKKGETVKEKWIIEKISNNLKIISPILLFSLIWDFHESFDEIRWYCIVWKKKDVFFNLK